MLNSKKIAATAGVLCSFALIGLGAGQAVGGESSGGCVQDSKGNVNCVQKSEYRVTSGQYGNVHVVNQQTQDCSSACVSSFGLGDKKKS
ncbi:hypothetical protein RKE30_34980 [Streptomyces sp. Li-HN-5-11]|uniref:hypothetical protein n=1 Tax=Streptomyces sp. Li-HN-5-11 TaxID=3075432 RepID=UPI0028A5C813|nr:hypothetical protein [Streptomyces sp. Li-HN-5-11]WNM35203.1 hypothetical protein RKE30_34980 [Streptomyces sp. Li-HN-5-11]